MNFLNEDQELELEVCPIDFIGDEVMPDLVTPLANREDIPEVNTMLIDNGVLLLPDDQEAINQILEVASQYTEMDLKICKRKRPS
jgi:hypothetical protein